MLPGATAPLLSPLLTKPSPAKAGAKCESPLTWLMPSTGPGASQRRRPAQLEHPARASPSGSCTQVSPQLMLQALTKDCRPHTSSGQPLHALWLLPSGPKPGTSGNPSQLALLLSSGGPEPGISRGQSWPVTQLQLNGLKPGASGSGLRFRAQPHPRDSRARTSSDQPQITS